MMMKVLGESVASFVLARFLLSKGFTESPKDLKWTVCEVTNHIHVSMRRLEMYSAKIHNQTNKQGALVR